MAKKIETPGAAEKKAEELAKKEWSRPAPKEGAGWHYDAARIGRKWYFVEG